MYNASFLLLGFLVLQGTQPIMDIGRFSFTLGQYTYLYNFSTITVTLKFLSIMEV